MQGQAFRHTLVAPRRHSAEVLCGRRHFLAALPCPILKRSSHIRALQDAFRDPSSPFYLAPGTQGPESPDPPTDAELLHTNARAEDTANDDPAEAARKHLTELGYDPSSFWEQRIVWGDHDAFQHVNNVRYVRFFESSRIEWMVSLARELGGEARAVDMLNGKGVSLILASISLTYKRPVVYPDTLLVAHKPYATSVDGSPKRLPKTHFKVAGAMYSYAQRRVVTTCDSALVWYDYDRLTKCDPGARALQVLQRRMDLGQLSLQS